MPDRAWEQVFRAEHGRVVATLARRFGDLDLAEDATSEALVVALEKWSEEGLPPNPGAWLTTVGARKALDRLRREAKRDGKQQEAVTMVDDSPPDDLGVVEDDRLRLVFTCCHPALAPENRVALTLRMLGGLTVAEIARAFLVPETTMAQRITRSKAKIKQAKIPYRVPREADLPARVGGVLAVLYLVFNEGYLATSEETDPIRGELCDEAVRLTRLVVQLMPDEPEALGLLALMLLIDARRAARERDGMLVTLDQQDRRLWDAERIDEGHALVRRCLQVGRPGPYQLQAAIQAVHDDALEFPDTQWDQVVALYDQLLAVAPSPIVVMNRAVAVAELDGPEVGLALVEELDLDGYHAWHATRADLLRRLGRSDEARDAYLRAAELTQNAAERAWLQARSTG
ncbi:RNA polymerase sigma factor [Aeromicrobium sp. Root495]|uniref:RNA polymerase sigma factor n=1 Tax=Aeromicrobium sp. Root495 TaxID=1736550 RepID=UPI000AE69611|nr:RNA polymerase sigma factor [Aeromicrobium sp. Root495]